MAGREQRVTLPAEAAMIDAGHWEDRGIGAKLGHWRVFLLRRSVAVDSLHHVLRAFSALSRSELEALLVELFTEASP